MLAGGEKKCLKGEKKKEVNKSAAAELPSCRAAGLQGRMSEKEEEGKKIKNKSRILQLPLEVRPPESQS